MSAKKIYFTPGPSQTYFTFEEHLKHAMRDQIASISHRGKEFEQVFRTASEHLREIAQLPSDYHVFFTASATEVWERSLQNCVQQSSFHLVNGSFSKRYCDISGALGLKNHSAQAAAGSCVAVDGLSIPEEAELIAITHNETSTGATQPLSDVALLREAYPDKLIALDIVSSFPYVDVDYSQVDMAYFSVQKCFGLPAGLGVWFVNEKCIERSRALNAAGKSTGSYHSLTSLLEKSKKNQTPETPNILNIYLLGKVAGDMLEKGIAKIRQETDYKSAVLYHMLEQHENLSPFVKESQYRSKTTIVGQIDKGNQDFVDALARKGMVLGRGYGSFKSEHIRIANFPTHSKEQIESLADQLAVGS